MKYIDFTTSLPQGYDPEQVARRVRHLAARLRDFGPGGPELLSAVQLTPHLAFEELDHVWGCLFELLF